MGKPRYFRFDVEKVLAELCQDLNIPRKMIRLSTYTSSKLRLRNRLGSCGINVNHQGELTSYEVRIRVKGSSIEDQIEALAHELVHVQQYYRGDFTIKIKLHKVGNKERISYSEYWQGKNIRDWVCNSWKQYKALPWEVEAFAREDLLASKFSHIWN